MVKKHIKVAQLTDLHLLNNKNLLINDINPYDNLKSIISKVLSNKYDYLFISGDISENGSIESYQLIKTIFDDIGVSICCIPGNHDNKTNMLEVLSESNNIKFSEKLSLPNWDILFLDTAFDGEPHGLLTNKALEKLQFNIESSNSPNICIVMHHLPCVIENPYIDCEILKNSSEFQKIIEGTKVRFVTFGHVHNYYTININSISYESTPATSFQLKIKGGVPQFVVEKKYGFKELLFTESEVISRCVWGGSSG